MRRSFRRKSWGKTLSGPDHRNQDGVVCDHPALGFFWYRRKAVWCRVSGMLPIVFAGWIEEGRLLRSSRVKHHSFADQKAPHVLEFNAQAGLVGLLLARAGWRATFVDPNGQNLELILRSASESGLQNQVTVIQSEFHNLPNALGLIPSVDIAVTLDAGSGSDIALSWKTLLEQHQQSCISPSGSDSVSLLPERIAIGYPSSTMGSADATSSFLASGLGMELDRLALMNVRAIRTIGAAAVAFEEVRKPNALSTDWKSPHREQFEFYNEEMTGRGQRRVRSDRSARLMRLVGADMKMSWAPQQIH